MKQEYIKQWLQVKRESFEENYDKLLHFMYQYNRLPKMREDEKLCLWISEMMKEKRSKRLEQEFIDRLNDIGFPWDFKDLVWMERARQVIKILTTEKREITRRSDGLLYHWLKAQMEMLEKNKLANQRKAIVERCKQLLEEMNKASFSEPVALLSLEEKQWMAKFKELLLFKESNAGRWPKQNRLDVVERNLALWCRRLREKYEKKQLTESQLEKLQSIDFDFKKKTKAWLLYFEELKTCLNLQQMLPKKNRTLRNWVNIQKATFSELSPEKQQLLHSIRFFDFFPTVTFWEKKLAALQQYIATYGKEPDVESDYTLYKWLLLQRRWYRLDSLPSKYCEQMQNTGISLTKIQSPLDTKWEIKYRALQRFRENNPHRWPQIKKEDEKQLARWCNIQRQAMAGTSAGQKPLTKERTDKLNEIQFEWMLEEPQNLIWERHFATLKNYITDKETTYIPSSIDGKSNPLYKWLLRQKTFAKKQTLSAEHTEKLKSLGVL